MEIKENEGFYTVSYLFLITCRNDYGEKNFPRDTPDEIHKYDQDIDVKNDKVTYSTKQTKWHLTESGRKRIENLKVM